MLRMTTIILVILASTVKVSQAAILVSDDFNDGVLDTSIWTTATQTDGDLIEQNGRIEMRNGAALITTNQFDPLAVGGLRINGEYTTVISTFEDRVGVRTRGSGGMDAGVGPSFDGILSSFNTTGDFGTFGSSSAILECQTGPGCLQLVNVPTGPDVGNGETFSFEVIDTGTQVSIQIDLLDGTPISFIEAPTSSDFALDFISFSMRENVVGERLAYLDNITISTLESSLEVPEPSTNFISFWGVLGLGILLTRQASRRH